MPGKGGALLLREAGLTDTGERKYASVTGAKDYRWLESEAVYQLQMQEDIDKDISTGKSMRQLRKSPSTATSTGSLVTTVLLPGQHRIFHGAMRKKKQQEILT